MLLDVEYLMANHLSVECVHLEACGGYRDVSSVST